MPEPDHQPHFTLDASRVAQRLWVGSQPPVDRRMPAFQVLVLCAEEIQPTSLAYSGTIARCPLPDSELTQVQTNRALSTGKYVAQRLSRGDRVLVTCAMGINRSALVASLALGLVTRMTADQIITRMRIFRHERCLENEHFQEILRRYVGDRK